MNAARSIAAAGVVPDERNWRVTESEATLHCPI
jgi:hypothetical protein